MTDPFPDINRIIQVDNSIRYSCSRPPPKVDVLNDVNYIGYMGITLVRLLFTGKVKFALVVLWIQLEAVM